VVADCRRLRQRPRWLAHGRTRWIDAAATFLVVLLAACDGAAEPEAQGLGGGGDGAWPAGEVDERIESLADHIGGFSRAMMEVGYRYNELYFAGSEGNWPLAEYHAKKIGDAIDDGIERRPARGRSARPFLDRDLPALKAAIEARDGEAFLHEYDRLTHACNLCHQRENMEFIGIVRPERRLFPWRTP
jgi:hypothetical protein